MITWTIYLGSREASEPIYRTGDLLCALSECVVRRFMHQRRVALHLWSEQLGLAVCLVEFPADGGQPQIAPVTPDVLQALSELPDEAIPGLAQPADQPSVFVRRASIRVC